MSGTKMVPEAMRNGTKMLRNTVQVSNQAPETVTLIEAKQESSQNASLK